MEAMTAPFSSFVREEFVAEGIGHPPRWPNRDFLTLTYASRGPAHTYLTLPEAQLNELNGKNNRITSLELTR